MRASVTFMKGHVLFTAVALLGLCAPALASDGENAFSISLGYATYSLAEDTSSHGSALGLEYERGFTDALSWRIAAGGGAFYGDSQLSYGANLAFGVTYVFDVLKFVPFAQAGVGGIVIAADGTEIKPLIELGAGLDILRSRSFSYGVVVKFETFLQQTSLFTAAARATWRWGFF